MYVAMTRARRKVFIITEDKNESFFVSELEGSQKTDESKTLCRECGGEMEQRSSRFGPFLGCVNFPECTYKSKMRRPHRPKSLH